MNMHEFETIDLNNLNNVTGGDFLGDLWDATKGAVRIVASPVTATVNGVVETVGALQQGHNLGDSLSSGLVQAAGMNAPALSQIPARP